MQPAAEADVDLSEIFSLDKIAYNARNINYWCVFVVWLPRTRTHTKRAITAEPCRVHAPCSRVFVAILAGAASGIMGIQGIAGFVAFFASSMVLSLGMYLKMDSNPKPYFKTGSDVWTEGIGQALMVCRHRGDAWHILLRALVAASTHRTNSSNSQRAPFHRAAACAVIRDVLDAILRHRAHLLSNPFRGTTRHGTGAGPGVRAPCVLWCALAPPCSAVRGARRPERCPPPGSRVSSATVQSFQHAHVSFLL